MVEEVSRMIVVEKQVEEVAHGTASHCVMPMCSADLAEEKTVYRDGGYNYHHKSLRWEKPTFCITPSS
jgi:hypothetical protein